MLQQKNPSHLIKTFQSFGFTKYESEILVCELFYGTAKTCITDKRSLDEIKGITITPLSLQIHSETKVSDPQSTDLNIEDSEILINNKSKNMLTYTN